MSRMSEKQREYLLQRVDDLVRNEKQGFELKLADKKTEQAKKLFPEFLKKVKLDKKLEKLKQLENDYQAMIENMIEVVSQMYKDQGNSAHFYNNSNSADIENKLRILAQDVIDKEFQKTPEGEALLHLDTVHQELQDYIWSAGSETEQLFKTIGHVLNKKANIQLGYSKIALPDK